MWNTFLPDLLVALVGAIIGSIFTVGIALATYVISRRRRERGALRGLIVEMHRRRALVPVESVRVVPNAAALDDYRRVSLSILAIRKDIRVTRTAIRPELSVQRQLSDMTSACNRYLEASQRDPDHYWFALMELRNALVSTIGEIAAATPSVEALAPGAAAFDND